MAVMAKSEENDYLGKPSYRQEGNIKIDLK